MAYVKAEVKAELNQASKTSDINNNSTYAWPDQVENKVFPQNVMPQVATSQFQANSNNRKNNKDNDDKKIFVGGLHYNTTEETLNQHFSQYGNLEDVVVIRHPDTKRSRGFGFVTFSSQEEVDACQKARPHILDDKTVETKRAVPRGVQTPTKGPNRGLGSASVENKVFVGGIKEDVDDEELKAYFSSYGNVKQVKILVDKTTGRKRGFAFVEFDDYDPVHKCILQRNHQIRGNRVDVKNAVSRKDSNSHGQQRNMYPRNNATSTSANYSWMNGGGYGQQAASGPAGYAWNYYNNGYGVANEAAVAQSHMGYGQTMQDGYGYGAQVYNGVQAPAAPGDSMLTQMYQNYNGAPTHGYGNGMAATSGGGPLRTPPHKGYRQSPYQTSDNEHKK